MTTSDRVDLYEQRKAAEANEQGHNGWKNYPTWAVNLWLRSLAAEAGQLDQAPEDLARYARNRLAADLKDWVSNELAPDLGASFAADLLGYALGEVDWYEIAAAWLEEAERDQ